MTSRKKLPRKRNIQEIHIQQPGEKYNCQNDIPEIAKLQTNFLQNFSPVRIVPDTGQQYHRQEQQTADPECSPNNMQPYHYIIKVIQRHN